MCVPNHAFPCTSNSTTPQVHSSSPCIRELYWRSASWLCSFQPTRALLPPKKYHISIFLNLQQTQSLIDALRLADQVSCPYERRYKKNKRYQQKNQKNSIARSMPTLVENQSFPIVKYSPRVSVGGIELSNEEVFKLTVILEKIILLTVAVCVL